MRLWRNAVAFRLFFAWSVVASLATAILLVTQAHGQTNIEPKRVLMLHSFGLRFKPWTEYAQIIRSEMSRRFKAPIDFHDHSLLTARLGDDQSDRPFVNYLHSLYAGKAPDLIVAIGAPAANFVQRYRESVFPGVPMLFTVVEARRVQHDKLTRNDTVVATAHDFPAAFESILHVLPQTKLIAIVNGASPNERFWLGELQRETAFLAERVELKFYNEMSFEQILADASKLPPHSAVFFHLMNVDAAGVAHETQSALKRLVEASSAPIFSQGDGSFGEGLVGGPMHSIQEGSEVAAAVAVRILNGEQAGDIKTPPTRFAAPRFDWNQMQRWGISESRLPPGSETLFREPSAWDRYSWQIALIAAVILVQAGLIVALLNAHHQRRLALVQSAQRTRELAHVNRFSMAGELTASIAHELNQPLGSILTNAETADVMLKSATPDLGELREIVKDILHDDRRASEVIRRIRSLLQKVPFDPKPLNLNEVVRETVDLLSAVARGRMVELRSSPAPVALLVICDNIQLQQLIINLVVNAMDAMKETPPEDRTISIQVSRMEDFAELSVSDRGPGIPEEKLKEVFEPFFTSKADGMGMGLSIARTIVEAHNGQIWAINRDHGGASFRIRLPLA
jgi:signal transduction histidine kinase